jgi:hypothetical protein
MGVMKNRPEERLFTGKWLLIGALCFSLYGIILLSLDQEWVLWAGSMTLGGLYVPDPPPRLFEDPREVFQVASVFSLLGLVALALLTVVMGEVRFGWLSWLRAQWRERCAQEALQARERPEVGAVSSFLDIDLPREIPPS